MKIFINLLLFSTSLNAHAESLGKYLCSAEDDIQSRYSVAIDLDKNDVVSIKEGLNSSDPSLWKTIYSINNHVYCGYKPTEFNNISCGFNTQHDTVTGFTTKDLLCQRNYPDGTNSTLTTGSLYFNTNQLEGGFHCNVRNIPSKSMRLFDCKIQP